MYNIFMINNKKVIGFICECNPFHKGHKRLIDNAKNNADIIIAVMSGNFVQRGEPSVYNKYERANELLKNGVDIVIELPIEYILSSAKYFARAGIGILNKLGIVDMLIFGSKINNISKLKHYANQKIDEKLVNPNSEMQMLLKSGATYSKAIASLYNKDLSSNDILAVEYLRALNNSKSSIIPISIKRENDLPTASNLRENIKTKITTNSFSNILNYILFDAKNNNRNLFNISSLNKDLYNTIMNTNLNHLTFDEFALKLKTKNRTLANIKRALFNIIFNIDNRTLSKTKYGLNPNYIRIIGIKKGALSLLKYIKIPFIMSYSPNSFKDYEKKYSKSLIKNKSVLYNIYASNLYYYLSNEKITEATKKVLIF